MRGKLIAVFSIVVLIVGLVSFAVTRVLVSDLVANPEQARKDGARAVLAANTQFHLLALSMERWLDDQSNDPKAREPFLRDEVKARGNETTAQSDRLAALAKVEFKNTPPALVAFVDKTGTSMGRDGGALLRGEPLGQAHPHLVEVITKGVTGADLWVDKARNEQMLVAYAAVRNEKNEIVGGILMGTPLDDGLLERVSEATTGRPIVLAVVNGDAVEIAAKSQASTPDMLNPLLNKQKGAVKGALGKGGPVPVEAVDGYMSAAASLSGFGNGQRGVVVAFAPVSIVASVNGPVLPILGATLLGLAMVVVASFLLDTYYSRPIVELEEGLLAIISGDQNKRFEIEHPEFGGLAHRINTLLNTLLGVQEDNTDAEGRSSIAPSAAAFAEDFNADAEALKAEPAERYYARLFAEYIDAKKSLGERYEHITEQTFTDRIKSMERESSERQGRPIRYKVERAEKEVRLIAVMLD